MKIVIIGGVAGGATALARIRRLDNRAEIVLVERGPHVSYANCGLPYYIGRVIQRREALFVSTKESIEAQYNADIRDLTEAVSVDPIKKEVLLKDLRTGKETTESYDKLLLSTGSRPFVPDVPGIHANNVFQLWTVPDMDAIDDFIRSKRPQRAAVVGGGFIGLEMAENLVERGLAVTLVEMADQVMPPLDPDMARPVANHLHGKGVRLKLGIGFSGMSDDGKEVLLSNGESVFADLVLLSIGVRPNNELAKTAGLTLGARGGIVVDAYGKTSDPNIYAVGDVIEVADSVLGGKTMIPLAGPANKQGRAVAANLLGQQPEAYAGTMGTSVAKVFDLTVASVGANEKGLLRAGKVYGKDFHITLIHPMGHAGYYPGAKPMTLKLIFGADRNVLGAQIVGYDGVDKRIDTIASALFYKGTVDDLAAFELAYAPPYSSAKDPVNFAGFTAQNILSGLTHPVRCEELPAVADKYTLLDIREEAERFVGAIPGSVAIPLSELHGRTQELDPDKAYLVYCSVGLRGYVAERVLAGEGFEVANLLGGFRSWQEWQTDLTAEPDPCAIQSSTQFSAISSIQDAALSQMEVSEGEKRMELLDVCGLSCPGPIVQVGKVMADAADGETLEIVATDPGFARDIASWCKNTGNALLASRAEGGRFFAMIRKGAADAGSLSNTAPESGRQVVRSSPIKEKTMIVFDGDLDKAIAAFIIATGAAAMGNKVHMFFTFWGLSVIRKENPPPQQKDFMSKMFAQMLPKGSKKLKLSQFNMAGMGSKMIRGVMSTKGVSSLEELIRDALDAGVELTACQMSMDVMGLTIDDLLEGVKIGGVATMLDNSDQSNMNLFI